MDAPLNEGSKQFVDPVAEYLASFKQNPPPRPSKNPEPAPNSATNALSAVRTFAGDLSHTVSEDNISAVKIAALESDRRIIEKTYHSRRPFIFSVFGVAFGLAVIVGGGAIIYFGQKNNSSGQVPVTASPIIVADKEFGISLAGASRSSLVSELQSAAVVLPITVGQVAEVIFTEPSSPTSQSVAGVQQATFNQVVEAFGWQAPPDLLNNISGYFFGYEALAGSNEPFLILKVSDYGASYQAMLNWEPMMTADFGGLFFNAAALAPIPSATAPSAEISTTTASASSSTLYTQVTTASLSQKNFQDSLINNKDVRALVGQGSQPVFLYSFLDPETILITSTSEAFGSVFNRLTNLVSQ